MNTDELVKATRAQPHVVDEGAIRQEYFYEAGVLMLRETMHGRTIELPVHVAVKQSFFDRMSLYYGPNAQAQSHETPTP